MKALIKKIDHQLLGIAGITLIMTGLLFSRASLSIGMIVLLASAVFNVGIRENFRRLLRHPAMMALSGIFLLYLLSSINSENLPFLEERLRIKLPFLILPFAFLSLPRFPERIYHRFLYLFFWLIVLLSIRSLWLFFLDMENIVEVYREGKVMPTPVFHMRFSLMVAYCVAIGGYLFQKGFHIRWPAERYVTLAATAFLIIYLHVLAVRSGLLALYFILMYFLAVQILRRRQYLLGLALVLVVGISFALAYHFVPTLKNKIDYTIYGVNLFLEKRNLYELSDSYRLASIEAGISIGNRHPWTGVGIGDMADACDEYFSEHYPTLVGLRMMPHNQFILVYAAIGIFGLLYFSWAIVQPLLYRKGYHKPLMLTFYLVAFASFLVEYPLETQLGVGFFLLFVLMGIRFSDDGEADK